MDSEARKAFILREIQTILDSIPNLKHTLLSLKEGHIMDEQGLRLGTGTGYDFRLGANQRKSVYPINENLGIEYYVPRDMDNDINVFKSYIREQGGDTYKIVGTIGPYRNINAYILIKNGIDSLPNANTYKASKNYIKITVQGGGRRRKYTKKARKNRRRSRKHRS
jgi:hypothetical protein